MSSTGIMIKEKDVIYMELSVSINQNQLKELLLQVKLVRPVFIWGAPGIGKSAIVEQFAAELGLPCVCLTGSQLAPEDLIGVPQIVNGTSVFCPPRCLVQKEPFCLFLDELNACSLEVQKAFYSLILERRIGEYHLPDGSIVVGAGNRIRPHFFEYTTTLSSASSICQHRGTKENVPARAKYALTGTRKNFTQIVLPYHT